MEDFGQDAITQLPLAEVSKHPDVAVIGHVQFYGMVGETTR
jgi:hypothetical protein